MDQVVRLVRLGDAGLALASPDEDLRGRTVVDAEGQDVGAVEDLIVGENDRRVYFVFVRGNGSEGPGTRSYLLPVEAVAQVQPDTVRVTFALERIAEVPRYDPASSDAGYFERVYDHFGIRSPDTGGLAGSSGRTHGFVHDGQ